MNQLLTEHNLEFLSFKGGCTGSSETTLVKMPHCHGSITVNSEIFARILFSRNFAYAGFLFVFVALRPMSTAMVIAGRSVHLSTLFPGQA